MEWDGMGCNSRDASPKGNASPSVGTHCNVPWSKDGVWGTQLHPRMLGPALPWDYPHPLTSVLESPMERLHTWAIYP